MNFFLTLTVRGSFHRKNFERKKIWGYAERNERAEAATGSYSVIGDSLQYIYSILKKNYLWLLPFYMVVATYFYYGKV